MTIMTGDSDTVDVQPAKRQKVDVACDLCRAKKIKCDSIRPVCGPCAKKKSNSTLCSWESSVVRGSQPSRAEVLKLRRRIKELEEQAVNGSDSTNNRNNNTNENTSDINNIDQSNKGNDSNNSSDNNNNDQNTNDSNNHNKDNHGDITDASRITPAAQSVQQDDISSIISDWAKAGSRIQLTPHDQHSASPDICGQTQNSTKSSRIPNSVSSEPTIGSVGSTSVDSDFYGRASALDFLTQMRNAVHQKLGITNSTTSTAPYDIQTRILGASATQRYKPIHYVLPGRRQADKLLYVYWNTLHALYPFLDKQDFIARYETLWMHRDSDEEDPVFLCALNLVFALSSHLDEDITPDERHTSATTFFERAEESMDLWRLNTLQSVQMLLLLSIYFQSICALSQSWMIIGVATRTAQSLGLHLSGTERKQVPQEQQELVQRVWQTCVLLDRMAAMTHGRPSMTTSSMNIKGRMSRFDGHDFFSQSSRLFEISHETLGGLYSEHLELRCPNRELLETLIGRTTMDNKWFILDTDRRLLDWYNNLPPYLKFKRGSLGSGSLGTFARQATILRQQYLHIKLLSLRPILSAYLSSEGDNSFTGSPTAPSLSEKIALQCSTTCVNLARELIEVSYSTCPSNPHLVGMTEAWWHNVLFIYSAATVLIAARLSPSILADVPEDSILTSYHRANKVLKSFQVFTPTIQRMVVALDQVYQIIPGNYSRSRQQAQQSEMHAGGYQDLSMQAEAREQDLLAQDLLFAAQPADKHRTDSLIDGISDEAIGHDINFDVTDFSWLTTLPFEF